MRVIRQRYGFGLCMLVTLTLALTACGGETATSAPAATVAGSAATAAGAASMATVAPTSAATATRAPAANTAAPTTGTAANATGSTSVATSTTVTMANATIAATTAPVATTAAPTTAPTTVSTSAATAAPATAASAPAGTTRAASATLFTVVPDQSEASYTVNEKFANLPAPNDAVGKTNQITGQIALGPDGKVTDGGKITVNVQSLTSDRSQRDNYIRMNSLQSSMFPDATIVITGAEGINGPLGSAPTQFKLTGTMTIHGVTKPITWDTTASMNGDTINGTATTTFKMGDFNITPPMVAILSTSDTVKLDMKITAKKAA